MTFNKRIKIQEKVAPGIGSFAVEEWYDKFEVWAHWVNVHGSEAWIADSVQAQRAATVTIRYRPDITEKMRIVYKDAVYLIVSIDNVRERNRILQIKVRAFFNG